MNRTMAVLLTGKDVGLRSTLARSATEVTSYKKKVEGAATSASKVAQGLKVALAGVAVAAAAFLVNGIGQAIKFEAAMRNVNSISKLSESSLAGLSNQVLELSTRVPQSAQTLARGLYDIASSGFQGAAGMEVLSVSAKAASAGLTTTDVSAKAIAASLNAYGLTARDAADVSDILFQTVNLGVVTFEELASELGDVVGGAAAAGVALDEVGAAVAAMTLSGLSAAEATTSLNRLLEKIVKPSDALSNTFANLGFESGKAALDAKGLHGVMELLRAATGGQITALLKLFPEIRAARGAFALMAADGRNYATTFAGIANEQARAGATQAAFNEQMKALDNQWKLFINNVNAAGIRLGTVFIPVLKSGLAGVQDFGRSLGQVLSQLATAAAPMVRSLGQAFQEIARLGGEVYDAIQPVAKLLATAFAAAAIVGLQAFAEALGAVAGFLADHPNLVRAVALAYGGLLLSNLVSTGAAAAKFAVQFRALLIMESLGPIIAGLATRLRALAIGLQGLMAGNVVQQTLGLGTAFRGLGTALTSALTSPVVAGAGFLAMLYGIQTGMDNAKRQANEMVSALTQDIQPTNLQSIRSALADVNAELERQRSMYPGTGSFEAGVRGMFELLTPLENKIYDNIEAINQLEDAAADLAGQASILEHDLATVSNSLGISQQQVEEFFRELDYDPSRGEQFIQMREDIRALIAEASQGTPAAEQLGESFDTAGDLAQSASDRLDAFKESLDALIGTMLGAFDAETAYAAGIQELTAAIQENGVTLDAWTEGGRANREALSGAVQAAVDWASEIATSTGSLQQGADALGLYRQQLIDTMVATGFSRAEAEEYINTLGLTPENLTTLIELAGTAEATEAMGQVFDAITQLDLTVAEPEVHLDNLPFLHNAQAVGEFLAQVGMEAPMARVLLDDSQFRPTAAQVSAWSQAYDDSTPQAIALLNIIDPQNRFATLSAAAAGWDAAHPTATAAVHDLASGVLAGIRSGLNSIDGRVATSHVRVVYTATGDAAAAIASGKRYRWGGIHQAQSGLTWEAGIVRDPTILFGERATGGEAFIPRLGSYPRSMSILAQAAKWYGAEVVPRGQAIRPVMGVSGRESFTFAPVVHVQVRADAGVDTGRLTKMLRREVDDAIGGQLDRLRRELRAR